MDIAAFAQGIGAEMVAGCVLAVVNGRKEYVYRDGEFTPKGRELYNAWQDSVTVPVETVPKRRGRPAREQRNG